MFADARNSIAIMKCSVRATSRSIRRRGDYSSNYWGNPLGSGVGYFPPETIDEFGSVASEEQIIQYLQRRLTERPELAYIDVTQRVIGDVDGKTVGVLGSRAWRIHRDRFERLKEP